MTGPGNWAVLRQGPMWARPVVVVEVVLKNCLQVSFVDDDNLVQIFPADCPDQSFDVRILPRRVRGGRTFFDTAGSYAPGKLGPVEAIAVAQHVLWRRHKRKRVDDLLPGPTGRGASVTAKCSTLRRAWASTTKTNNTER